jgi:GNAT superfamily N-acetyltransferase
MSLDSVTLRPPQPEDEGVWRGLWKDYCDFYGESVPEEITAGLWTRLLDESGTVRGLVATDAAGNLLGFAHYVLHPHTWSLQTLCYLEDLFVSPQARRKGIATLLINHLLELAREHGWRRVYWHTDTDNETARRTYDRFTLADNYVRYTITP